ncbi:hypothetical protein [Streptomyces sp. CC208A]|uniref:hypothetical protein n=1 Tax=Streptomyces sp. CC208A TaxID=3044573 RepID=UPI0024A8160D|nr:hypothetical protein [Streptomyces sp. CC208A]
MDEVRTVVSRDGTTIVYERYEGHGTGAGRGPAVVLVGEVPLARLLARSFPVFVYGGGSAGPYTVERELEGLAAVLEAAGPGVLALAAAAAGLPVGAVSVFEPPYAMPALPLEDAAAPVLVVDGGASPAPVRRAARALAASLPRGRHRTLTGQIHEVAPHVLAPVLAEFVTEVTEAVEVA